MTVNISVVLYFPGPIAFSPMGSVEINVWQNYYFFNFYKGFSLKGLIAVITIILQARKHNMMDKVQALELKGLGPNFGATIYL